MSGPAVGGAFSFLCFHTDAVYNRTMGIFSTFRSTQRGLRAVIEVGSYAVKAIAFEARGKSAPPKVLKKMVAKLSPSGSAERTAARLREVLFLMVKELGAVPEQITVAFGPHLAEQEVVSWSMHPPPTHTAYSQQKLGLYFSNLLEQSRDKSKVYLAAPLALYANGYRIKPEDLLHAKVGELIFQALMLYFPAKIGAEFIDTKRSLGGMPIEFMPLAIAYAQATTSVLASPDALFVDIGGEETQLLFIHEGLLEGLTTFPVGIRHFLRGIVRLTGGSNDHAEEVKHQYAHGFLKEAERVQLQSELTSEITLWEKNFMEALPSFYHLGPFPARVLVAGSTTPPPEVIDFLRSGTWITSQSYAVSPEVRLLTGQNLFQGDSLGGFIQGPEEVGLASLIIYSLHHEFVFPVTT